MAQQEFPQIFPGPGHVEHDPEAIWTTQLQTAREALAKAGITAADLAAIGVTNQRETTILWEKATGKPVANAIVWQSRVTAPICDRLKADGHEPTFRKKTGLVVDAYFSGTKIKHLLDSLDGLRARAARGEILFGTVDTLSDLAADRRQAARHRRQQRQPNAAVQHPHAGVGRRAAADPGRTARDAARGALVERGVRRDRSRRCSARVPIAGNAGDQQAALFGQACFEPGTAKNTYGTGCFMLLNTGDNARAVAEGAADDRRLASRRRHDVCARRLGLRRGRRGAVAARWPARRSRRPPTSKC